jgi:hypothetical protein
VALARRQQVDPGSPFHQCVLGYCLFPLLVASIISTVLHNIWIRLPVSLLAWAWCVWGKSPILSRAAAPFARLLIRLHWLPAVSLDELFGWYQDSRRPIVLGHLPSLPLLFRFQLDDHHSVNTLPEDHVFPRRAVWDRDSRIQQKGCEGIIDEFADARLERIVQSRCRDKIIYRSSKPRSFLLRLLCHGSHMQHRSIHLRELIDSFIRRSAISVLMLPVLPVIQPKELGTSRITLVNESR